MRSLKSIPLYALLLYAGFAHAQEKPASADAINGVKGVKQEAVQSIKRIEPPTIEQPVLNSAVQTVNKVGGIKTTDQVTPPPPPTANNAAQGVNKAEGIKAATPNAVQAIPPPPAGVASTIRAVQGVQGIIAPKQLNLEAALLMKEDGKGTPAGGGAEGGKGKAAAAALMSGSQGRRPATPAPTEDGRAVFQEFEKQAAPGS